MKDSDRRGTHDATVSFGMIGSVQPGAPRRVLCMLPTSFDRSAAESDPAAALYVRSYLLIRFTAGLIGLLLPTGLFVLDGIWLAGSWPATR